ncbi:hypothetical protein [Enterobacter sp. R1(2018)]|uniref:hypothetical protein n=1 Tax=Enterobacter sp. R1(2018) TaxID=2447891 RepID=UPI0015FEFB9F|nr:hypothetical protein [Enterobacter sp. R1(2018)]
MTIQRYDIREEETGRIKVTRTAVGDFVSYADLEAVKKERDALKAKMEMVNSLMEVAEQANKLAKEGVEKLGKERDAQAAENGQMLRLLTDISENHMEYLSEGEDCMMAGVPLDYVSEINMYVSRDVNAENPFAATDAFLAEVRASGIDQWIASRDGRWNGTTAEAERFAAQLRKGAAV